MASDNSVTFSLLFGFFQVVLIILYGIFVDYDPDTVSPKSTDAQHQYALIYPLYQDVHVMIFVGFGFLMTFLRKYEYSAVGLTFLVAAMCLQWGILTTNFWTRAISGPNWNNIHITVIECVIR